MMAERKLYKKLTGSTSGAWIELDIPVGMASSFSSGPNHSLFSTGGNLMFSLGLNDSGQLGTGDYEDSSDKWTKCVDIQLDENEQIISVGAGEKHSACCTQHRLFCWGDNSKNQCASDNSVNLTVPYEVTALSDFCSNGDAHPDGDSAQNALPLSFKSVSCMRHSTLCLTECGHLFIWGDGVEGTTSDLTTPAVVDSNCSSASLMRSVTLVPSPIAPLLDSRTVLDISCAMDFCLVIVEASDAADSGPKGRGHRRTISSVSATALLSISSSAQTESMDQGSVCPLGLEVGSDEVTHGGLTGENLELDVRIDSVLGQSVVELSCGDLVNSGRAETSKRLEAPHKGMKPPLLTIALPGIAQAMDGKAPSSSRRESREKAGAANAQELGQMKGIYSLHGRDTLDTRTADKNGSEGDSEDALTPTVGSMPSSAQTNNNDTNAYSDTKTSPSKQLPTAQTSSTKQTWTTSITSSAAMTTSAAAQLASNLSGKMAAAGGAIGGKIVSSMPVFGSGGGGTTIFGSKGAAGRDTSAAKDSYSGGNGPSFVDFGSNSVSETSSITSVPYDCVSVSSASDEPMWQFDSISMAEATATHSPDKSTHYSPFKGLGIVSCPCRGRSSVTTLHTEVWSWGDNGRGQLGLGDYLDRSQPCRVTNLDRQHIMRVTAHGDCVLALKADGKVYAWGDNSKNIPLDREEEQIKERLSLPSAVVTPTNTLPFSMRMGPSASSVLLADDKTSLHPCILDLEEKGTKEKSAGGTVWNKDSFFEKLNGTVEELWVTHTGERVALVASHTDPASLSLRELAVSECDLHSILSEVHSLFMDYIDSPDIMVPAARSYFEDVLTPLSSAFKRVKEAVGLNAVSIRSLKDPACLPHTPIVHDSQGYLGTFKVYMFAYHDFLAMNTARFVIKTGSSYFRKNKEKILQLCRRGGLDETDDLQLSLNQLLQLPLRRVSEYCHLLEEISFSLEIPDFLERVLGPWQSLKNLSSTDYLMAQSTSAFWDAYPSKVTEKMCKVNRRQVRESKSLNLQLVGGSRLHSHSFVLFSDAFVHIQNSTVKEYALPTLWVTSLPDADNSPNGRIQLVSPEDTVLLTSDDSSKKAEWVWILNRTIYAALRERQSRDHSSSTTDSRKYSVTSHASVTARKLLEFSGKCPTSRLATHVFLRSTAGPLYQASYTGVWRNGKMYGEGRLRWPDGRMYEGTFRDNQQEGYGVLIHKTMSGSEQQEETMRGTWKSGKLHGHGAVSYFSGDFYEGSFRGGLRHGHGMMATSDSIYIGAWKDDKMCGYGTFDGGILGDKYMGMWKDGKRNGPAVCISSSTGVYCEGNYVANKFCGVGLMLSPDHTSFDGQFSSFGEAGGQGIIVFPSGDVIEGTFSGSWQSGVKVSGTIFKPKPMTGSGAVLSASSPHTPCRSVRGGLIKQLWVPKSFGTRGVPAHRKWAEVFTWTLHTLGLRREDVAELLAFSAGGGVKVDSDRAWERMAVYLNQSAARQSSLEDSLIEDKELKRIPPHGKPSLYISHYHMIKKYLRKAFASNIHPLGAMLTVLADAVKASYSGTGADRRLITYAVQELKSVSERTYTVVRVLFPELPSVLSRTEVCPEPAPSAADTIDMESSILDPFPTSTTEVEEYLSPRIPQEEVEYVSPYLLLYPIVLAKVYPTVFSLYVLDLERDEAKYWKRVEKFNKQNDVTLLAYMGVQEKFRLVDDDIEPTVTSTLKGQCYSRASEALGVMTTAYCPEDKLGAIQECFNELTALAKRRLGSDSLLWSMDDLFPVAQFVVTRAQIPNLGAELAFIQDFSDIDLEFGEIGSLFTIVSSCLFQIMEEELPA